ncbi:MAG: hypothetical protein VKK04_12345 [Synechococcales bacterium]|nr:hypothetical protein [Synechococcales bacterium]
MPPILTRIAASLMLLPIWAIGWETVAIAEETRSLMDSPAIERLQEMFSPSVRATVGACAEQGGVDLSPGATAEGWVMCSDGTPDRTVAFADYVATTADILTASSLVGFRTVIATDPRLSPAMLVNFLAAPEGMEMLRTAILSAIVQSQLIPSQSEASISLLTGEVLNRLVPTLGDPTQLETLLGTPDQQAIVLNNFCGASGLPISQVQDLVPDLSSVQLYSICIEESGIAGEALRFLN